MKFSNNEYFMRAINLKFDENLVHNPEDAFCLLIQGLDYHSLDNLCNFTNNFYNYDEKNNINIYKLIQNLELDKKIVLNMAEFCVSQGLSLGNKLTNDGRFNTTSWINHSIYVGDVCFKLAYMIGLNPEIAKTIGLLHDYGRRDDHSFNHIIKGFEKLVALGYFNEAIGCLTHSFVNGGRCSNNERAIEGFYLDENGNQRWKDNLDKDDITLFLENYKYTKYDLILNIADLMATDKGIVSPFDRIKDIATRRTLDPVNRAFFLSELNNLLIFFLNEMNFFDEKLNLIKATKDITLEQIESNFYIVSQIFFEKFSEFNFETKFSYQKTNDRKNLIIK